MFGVEVTILMSTLGGFDLKLTHRGSPFKYSPSSPAVSTPAGPPPGSIFHTLHAALAARGDPAHPRLVTIYGRFDRDLSMAIGPVPISFTLEPPNNIPSYRMRSQAPPMSPLATDRFPPMEQAGPLSPQDSSAGKVIPRANFFPKAQTPRPRSRSFSGFDSSAAEVIIPQDSRYVSINSCKDEVNNSSCSVPKAERWDSVTSHADCERCGKAVKICACAVVRFDS